MPFNRPAAMPSLQTTSRFTSALCPATGRAPSTLLNQPLHLQQRASYCQSISRHIRASGLAGKGQLPRLGSSLRNSGNRSEIAASRHFSQTSCQQLKTIQEAKARQRSGPFSWKAGLLFVVAGVGLTVYFQQEKARLERKRIADQTKGVGKPKVGGPFELIDHNGKRFTDEDMKGKYALVYFGFTHCPDICPEELDKMAEMYEGVKSQVGNVLLPIFITCDPARDTPAVVKEYLKEFHPEFVGLTGTWENVKACCKAYRVYFSTPPNVKPGQDYLVDHSIYFYLMDPEGDFVEAIGRNFTAEEAAKLMANHIKDWNKPLNKS